MEPTSFTMNKVELNNLEDIRMLIKTTNNPVHKSVLKVLLGNVQTISKNSNYINKPINTLITQEIKSLLKGINFTIDTLSEIEPSPIDKLKPYLEERDILSQLLPSTLSYNQTREIISSLLPFSCIKEAMNLLNQHPLRASIDMKIASSIIKSLL
jgi:hypothetical protein